MFEPDAWLLIWVTAYCAVCVIVSVVYARSHADARQFFAPAGGIQTWPFVFAATAGLFGGWAITGQPSQIFADGFSFVNIGFAAITIPLASVLVMKRQWRLGRRFGFMTPGDLFGAYYKSQSIPLLAVGVALLFSVPFLATLYSASGALLEILTDGAISRQVGMWSLSAVLLGYCIAGGVGGVARVGMVQGVLFLGGAVALAIIALGEVDGFMNLGKALARLAGSKISANGFTHGFGGGDYSGMFAIPGVIQFTAGLGREAPSGGPWTAIMGLTFVLSLTGMQFAPALSVLGVASAGPRAFTIHQIWGSALCVGLVMFVAAPLQGVAGLLLGASDPVNGAGLSIAQGLPALAHGRQGDLVAQYIHALPEQQGWLTGLLAIAVVAALQATAAVYLVTTGTVLARDVHTPYFRAEAGPDDQRAVSRVAMLLLCLIALAMGTFAMKATLLLATLAIPSGFQLAPALLGPLWFPWLGRRAVALGLVAGLIVVVLTEPLGQWLTADVLPWGRWPWTIHSGVWGMAANIAVCVTVSAFSGVDVDRAHREAFHRHLDEGVARSASSAMRSAAWILLMGWTFFAIGPGAVLGDALFGAPGAGYAHWVFGVPSLWAWQIFWWILGVGLVWFLAVRMRFSVADASDQALVANPAIVTEGVQDG